MANLKGNTTIGGSLALTLGNIGKTLPSLTNLVSEGPWRAQLRGTTNSYYNSLLVSGPGRADDNSGSTWIFADSAVSEASAWGIRHAQLENLIEFYSSGTRRSYVDLASGNFVGNLSGNATTATTVNQVIPADTSADLLYATIGGNDFARIRGGGTSNGGWLEIATADDGTEPIYVRQYTGVFGSITRTATLLDGSGNTVFPGTVYSTFAGNLTGTASNANTLGGNPATASAGVANSIVQRDGSGYIQNTWFNSNRGAENTGAAQYIYDTGDGYMRKKDLGNVRSEIMSGGGTYGINITGSASSSSSSNFLNSNNQLIYGASGLNYFNINNASAGNNPASNEVPVGNTWWHIIRMNHGNSAGYYADLAVSMTSNNGIWRRVISSGSSIVNWTMMLDTGNVGSYAPTLTGTGASGTWGINITGSAGSAPNAGNSNSYYSVSSGDGNGIRFWTSTSYGISMGVSSLYQYGVVSDYSIKMNMDDGSPARGFTWGRLSYAPVASLNATSGNMQIAGTFYAGGDVYAYYSDERLKRKVGVVHNAIGKVKSLNAFYYVNNELANSKGFTDSDVQFGLSAQQVKAVLPEIVSNAPFDIKHNEDGTVESISGENYLTVNYAKLVPLLVEAIKEQQLQIDELKLTVYGK